MAFNLIDRTAGTNIGNMTDNGGLAAAFDGTTAQAATACARSVDASAGYVGKTLAASKRFGKAIIYGSNNFGYQSAGTNTVTVNIRGKAGTAPSSRTDGTIVGTASFTNTSDESTGRTITSTDGATLWDHIFADVTHNGADGKMLVAELELYEFNPVQASVVVIG